MKCAVIVLVALIAALLAMAFIVQRSDWHARIVYSRYELRRALQDLQESGSLRDHTNSLHLIYAQPFLFTNIVNIDDTNYRCAVAYDDP